MRKVLGRDSEKGPGFQKGLRPSAGVVSSNAKERSKRGIHKRGIHECRPLLSTVTKGGG